MKVIGIVGSPRKNGNTDTLVQAVLDGAKEKGCQTKKFILNEMKYSGCQACMYCKSHDHCQLDDDVSKLMKEMQDADAIVFGSPIHMSQLSGQFRLMQDRMYVFLGPDLKVRLKPGKKAIIVTSQGNPDLAMFESVPQGLAQMMKRWGVEVVDTIRMSGGRSPSAVEERKDLLERARAAGNFLC